MEIWAIDDPEKARALAGNVRMAVRAPEKKRAISKTVRIGSVAVVNVAGPITKYGLIDFFFGSYGTALVDLTEEMDAVRLDSSITHVVLRIESPGGTTTGIETAAAAVAKLAAVKPTVAWIDDLGCSAAYWLAVQCRYIVATPGAWVGSIGTYLVIEDYSTALKRSGIEIRVFSTGELKATGMWGTEITEEQSDYLKLHIREVNDPFNRSVRERRKLSDDKLRFVGTGRVMVAGLAEIAGQVDRIGPMETALEMIGATSAATKSIAGTSGTGFGHVAATTYPTKSYSESASARGYVR